MKSAAALLGDTPDRDYSGKLRTFAAFAEPEIRSLIRDLALKPGMRVLDAGCGTGEALAWLTEQIQPGGTAVGLDLARSHVAVASRRVPPTAMVLQADILHPPLPSRSFDLIWCVNCLNHLVDPVAGLRTLAALSRAGGRVAVGQSSFLPEMFFAWDARLERLTNEAVRQYYRDRYELDERDLGGVRSLVGWARTAGLAEVTARSVLIERISPLRAADREYLLESVFQGTWGARLEPYLSPADYAELRALCDPNGGRFALERPDFHFLQSFTLVTGAV